MRDERRKLEKLADRLMRDIHRLAWELRPAALDDFGLEMALRRYADEWAALSGVPVDFHSRGVTPQRLAPELETALYRITREALTNVFRHARPAASASCSNAGPTMFPLLWRMTARASMRRRCSGRRHPGQIGLVGNAGTGHAGRRLGRDRIQPGAGTTVFARLPLA